MPNIDGRGGVQSLGRLTSPPSGMDHLQGACIASSELTVGTVAVFFRRFMFVKHFNSEL